MKPDKHITASLIISSAVYFYFKSWTAFFVSFLAGVFIDVDHLLDYFMQQGLTFKIARVYHWFSEHKYKYIWIFLHSIELMVILWVAIYVFKLGLFWIALAIGFTQHLILDIFFNRNFIYWYAYFLAYRFLKGFKRAYISSV